MDPVITSAHNQTIKQLRKLSTSSKARRDTSTYIAEGAHLVASYLSTGQTPISYVCAESALENPEIQQLIDKLQEVDRTITADSLFESLTSIHANTGILLLFTPKHPKTTDIPANSTSILLEDVQDPGNLGTILRTATAAGVSDVFLSSGCTSPWSQKALRAGMGAQFGVTIHEDTDLSSLIAASPVPVFATVLSSKSTSLYTLDLARPLAWLFGSEGQGLSETLSRQVATHILIPQNNTPVESLNVAAAAAVCLYEQYRQLS